MAIETAINMQCDKNSDKNTVMQIHDQKTVPIIL